MSALFRWLFVWPDRRPEDAPPRTWPTWLATVLQGLFGLASWQKSDGTRRNYFVWLLRSAQGVAVRLVLLVALLAITAYFLLHGSLPDLDGSRTVAGLTGEVRIERDGQSIPTIAAASRADVFLGLGFVHAQDRFFQMDLARRYAAGELSALLGPGTINVDQSIRPLRLRETIRSLLARLSSDKRAELDAYVAGVNAGLAHLTVRPPEYLVLQAAPEPWTAEDTGLVLLAVMLTLQDDNWAIERFRGAAQLTLPESLYRLLDARGTEWDAPLVGGPIPTPRLPTADEFDLTKPQPPPRRRPVIGRGPDERPVFGSNNWALAGSETRHGGAIVCNDMHLALRAPHIWYRAGLAWDSPRDGRAMKAWGASYPGVPGLVVGSNQLVAWALTNAEVDTADLVRLERDLGDESRYRTPDGFEPFQIHADSIAVSGHPARPIQYTWTRWGPVLPGHPHFALRWVVHQPEGLSFAWLDLLESRTLDEALDQANRTPSPHQNFVAGDAAGAVGWTVLGVFPKRVGFDGRLPVSWADGTCYWDGFHPPEATPRVVRPRVWTANNRVVDGAGLALIGEAGFDRGARAGQIRDALLALDKPDEAAAFDLALDDRALFLKRWRDLLSATLEKMQHDDADLLAGMRREVATSADRAGIDRVGYRLVVEFRDQVFNEVLDPLVQRCYAEARDFDVRYLRQREGAVWKILQERPNHLLSPAFATRSYDELLEKAARTVAHQVRQSPGGLAGFTWGARNVSKIEHPLGKALGQLPVVGGWLDDRLNMERRPLDGAMADLPRIQGPSFGASERMAVSPGREADGYFQMPCGQSGHFLSPHYRDMHEAWMAGTRTPFLPGPAVHTLTLKP